MIITPTVNDINKRIKIFSFILLLVIYLPLRSVFGRLFTGISFIKPIADNFVEIIILLILGWVILKRTLSRRGLIRTPLDLPLFFLICSILLSMLVNGRANLSAINNAVSFVRYISIYYVVVNLAVTDKDVKNLFNTIIVLGLGLSVFTVILYLIPPLNSLVERFFLPVNKLVIKVGSVRGSFPVEVELAGFLLVSFIVYMVSARRSRGLVSFLLIEIIYPVLFLFAIFATYKRMVLLLAVFVLLQNWLNRNVRLRQQNMVRYFMFFIFALLFISVLIADLPSAYADYFTLAGQSLDVRKKEFDLALFFSQFLSPLYWNRVFAAQRGWVLVVVTPYMLTSQYWLFGLSPDKVFTQGVLAAQSADLSRMVTFGALEDVYWAALLVYYGLAGLLLFSYIAYKLFYISQKIPSDGDSRVPMMISRSFGTYLVLFLLCGFVYRVPELRTTSFFFWLFAGLATKYYKQALTQDRKPDSR